MEHFDPAIVLYICGLQLQVFIKRRSHGHALVFFDGSHFFLLFKNCNLHRTERKEEKVLSLQTDLLIFWGENSISFPWHTVHEAWSLTVFPLNLDFTLYVTLSPSQHFTFLAWTFLFSLPYLMFPVFYCCSWAALHFWACFIYLHPVWKQKLL